jgi:hypothetical protein
MELDIIIFPLGEKILKINGLNDGLDLMKWLHLAMQVGRQWVNQCLTRAVPMKEFLSFALTQC